MRFLPAAIAAFLGTVATAPTEAALLPGDSTRMLAFGGLSRSYLLHVPASYDGATAVPLVLDFHGYTSNATQQRGISGMVAVSNREGFLLVHPDGIGHAWNAGLCCPGAAPDDVGFIRAVVAAVAAEGNVDAGRVYATGLSNGGAISQRLACDAADLFAATAPMAFPVPFRPLSQCHPVRPIPVLTFMGLVDVLVRYDGGLFPSAPATFDYWHDLDDCSGTSPDVVVTQGDSRCETYTQCASGVEAGLCSITAQTFGGTSVDGHILYLNDDFVLAEVAWAFLSRFRLPAAPASFRSATVAGTTRLKLRGRPALTSDTSWEFGVGAGTWWANDATDHPFAGVALGKGRRRTLTFSTDAAMSLLAALAERLGVEPATLALDGHPQLRATLARRARVTGTVKLGGAKPGTFRVKLAGRLVQ
jgi:polyhydroxybutyrate depolymerase